MTDPVLAMDSMTYERSSIEQWYPCLSKTRRLGLRPAGSPEASISVRARPRLPQASASLGQSAARAAFMLADHAHSVFDAGSPRAPRQGCRSPHP
eukprot:scaffold95520_cov51-Phaeocystis_antarctica.AAC.1